MPWMENIKNVVVLVEENRLFDTFAGGLSYSHDIDGLLHTKYELVCARAIPKNVAPDDPNHGISGLNMEVLGTYHPDEEDVDEREEMETMMGFVTEQASTYKTVNLTRAAVAISYYAQDHIPVFATMAENFFSSTDGLRPSLARPAYLTSGTSHGHCRNDASFNVAALPQRSIFQQLSEAGIEWINYHNSTTDPMSNPPTGFNPDALFYTWTLTSGKWKTNIIQIRDFYSEGRQTSSGFMKGIYEALRGSPQWNETLLILTFDEHVGVSVGDGLTYTELSPDGKNMIFDFKRVDVRVPTLVISPWVEKGMIEHKGKNNCKEYTHTSIAAFIAKLWGLDDLTPRTTWSSTFEHLITDKFRDDTPSTVSEPVSF
ncbi:phosphoesterase family-domain-containing protein [Lipomyces starkeyi]|uniref:Uncharacterized protein n=1 Tax=Lipomyces starkeyi NRRL Y-11557 TaxID=675824 RepID=A0A1E3PW55_LIPST|nr:hypothetical protein LIPSTDRAFT_120912 [Lipomyces starkeyi NRRL Y-11557]